MQSKMTFLIFLSILLVFSNHTKCHARDTITISTALRDNRETLVSAGKRFELGFFSPEGNSSSRYVGIWYYQRKPQTVVWVANRDKPLLDPTGVVAIDEDGELKVSDSRATYFSTEFGSSSISNRSAKLLDSGNLVLIDGQSGTRLWQSFKNPTDTFLPGMLMKDELKLTSWETPGNPKNGNYTFQQDDQNDNLYTIMKRTDRSIYWRSGEPGKFFGTGDMPYLVAALLTNCRTSPEQQSFYKQSLPYISPPKNPTGLRLFYSNTRLLLNSSGQLQFYSWENQSGWSVLWSEPHDACSVYNVCGNFGSCSSKNGLACKCFPGFEPASIDNWNLGEFSSGCRRKTAPCSKNEEPVTFLDLKSMKVGKPDLQVPGPDTEAVCRAECHEDCHCQAYSFIGNFNGSRTNNTGCWIWTSDLKKLQEKYTDEGRNLSIRVAVSDIESTKRDCKPCGATVIPYPLSTGPECGDPMYHSFYCNHSTGQVNFQIPNGPYEVVSISKEQRKFVIEVDEEIAESCEASAKKIMVLNQSTPFHVTNSCFTDPLSVSSVNNSTVNNSTQWPHKVKIGWNPPSEPTCNSSTDCQDWPNSNCNGTGNRGRCICGPTYRWDGSSLNCTAENPNQEALSTINIRVVVIVTLVIAAVLAVCSLGYFFCKRKMLPETTEDAESILRNTLTNVYDSDEQPTDLLSEDDRKGTNVSFFKLESILAATESFSDANKLGEGGFGPVYRGKFPGEQDIAVKRLSSHSGQGMEEFQNEVVLIAKLQHRNLVRLLGYCVKRDEKILLYEYMPNKSLDAFIFDKKFCMLLDWTKRFDIILGIARGLLYLHQDSRLRIIHRDLKTSNILLDEEMNPKISDFGLARIVEGKQTEANTNRVVGTYGYMSPEYALEGLFSVKSDVFSFGVIVLEIVSGKRNTGLYQSKEALNLLGYAWTLWKEEKALDLLDQALIDSCNKSEVLKCINIGLLCVQEDPNDRPTMANVVSVLGSEAATIPSPNQPAYVARKRLPSTSSSSSSKPETFSHNDLTISMPQGR